MKIFLLLALVIICIEANNSSENYKKCRTSEANFNKCLTDNANKGWPQFVKDYKLQSIPINDVKKAIPNFVSGVIPEGNLLGFENLKFVNISMNINNKTIDVIYNQPLLNLVGKYYIKGVFLALKLDDYGNMNLTYINGTYNYHAEYTIQERDGHEYINIKDFKMNFDIKKLIVDLDSTASKERGVIMKRLFNNNWQIINLLTEEVVGEILSEGYTPIIRKFLKQIPLSSIIN